jgi:hypothetical protein
MKAAITAAFAAVLVSASVATVALAGTGDDLGGDMPARISWADAKHRYGRVRTFVAQRGRYCSRDGNVLCATDDGGKHWRVDPGTGEGLVRSSPVGSTAGRTRLGMGHHTAGRPAPQNSERAQQSRFAR